MRKESCYTGFNMWRLVDTQQLYPLSRASLPLPWEVSLMSLVRRRMHLVPNLSLAPRAQHVFRHLPVSQRLHMEAEPQAATAPMQSESEGDEAEASVAPRPRFAS